MTGRGATACTLALLALLAGGCGAPPPAPPPAPVSTSGPTSAPAPDPGSSTSPAGSPEDVACAGHPGSADTVRSIAGAVANGPVLPAGVALFLVDVRMRAAEPAVADPDLAAARTELVAAIDDLDAQGRAALPPGGNPARNAVQLDAARIVAAVETIDRLCAAR